MRKLSPAELQRAANVARKRFLNNVERKRRRKEQARRTAAAHRDLRIAAPQILSFSKNFSGTVDFLDQFRDATLTDKSKYDRIHIDLAPIRRISVPAAIVLAAEFHRWAIIKRIRLRPIAPRKWSPRVRNLLSDLGVFELLGLPRVSDSSGTDDNITLTPLLSGIRTDGSKIDALQRSFEKIVKGFTLRPSLFDGLSEAAENAINHAYPDGYVPRHRFAGHRWWGASCIDPSEMRLRFFIFDQGAGIPYTLPTNALFEDIRAWLSERFGSIARNDSLMLRAALEAGRSRTRLENRGLGLQTMADVARGAPGSYMRILSGKGEIVYYSDDRIVVRDHNHHIGGTLIEWSMPADAFNVTTEDSDHDRD